MSEFVHTGDVVEIDVAGGIEFDWRGAVSAEGILEGLNTFGDPLYALCRSEAEVAADVVKFLSKFLRVPNVTVRIIDRSKRPHALLDGAVKTPHRFQMNRPARLSELIVLAGGINDDASGEIQIFRPANLNCTQAIDGKRAPDNKDRRLDILISDLLSGREPANPMIVSGDLIVVKRADVIYMIGGVANPLHISARTQTTLSRAIAMAGGVAKAGSSTVTLFRRENGESRSMEFDLEKIASGEVPDPPLKSFDIVEVPLKGAVKRKYPPIVTGAVAAPKNVPLRIVD